MLNNTAANSAQQEASHPIFTEFEHSITANLQDRTLKSDDVDAVLRLIRENKSLQILSLKKCGLFPEEIMRIAHAVAASPSIRTLDISENKALTTQGTVHLSNNQVISIAKAFRLKETCVVLTDDHIDKNIRLYLVHSKSLRCDFTMRHEYKKCKQSDINIVAFIDTLSEKVLANLNNPRDFKLDTSEIQSLSMGTNTLALLRIALSTRHEIPTAKIEQFLGITKYDIRNCTTSQSADIAFANSIAARYVRKNSRYDANPIGLDFKDFSKLSKGCDALVKNALMLKHSFTETEADHAIKNLKKECAKLIEKMEEGKAATESAATSKESKTTRSKNNPEQRGVGGGHASKPKRSIKFGDVLEVRPFQR